MLVCQTYNNIFGFLNKLLTCIVQNVYNNAKKNYKKFEMTKKMVVFLKHTVTILFIICAHKYYLSISLISAFLSCRSNNYRSKLCRQLRNRGTALTLTCTTTYSSGTYAWNLDGTPLYIILIISFITKTNATKIQQKYLQKWSNKSAACCNNNGWQYCRKLHLHCNCIRNYQ